MRASLQSWQVASSDRVREFHGERYSSWSRGDAKPVVQPGSSGECRRFGLHFILPPTPALGTPFAAGDATLNEMPVMAIRTMSRFEVFIGLWNTRGDVFATESGPAGQLFATDQYEWLPGKHFILHRADARFDAEVSRSIEIMGLDQKTKRAAAWSFDDRGSMDAFDLELRGKRWRIVGENVRFDGRFSTDDSRLRGWWEVKGRKSGWQPWIDLSLERA